MSETEEELKPDFDISYLKEMATKQQKATLSRMVEAGWVATHIWEFHVGELAVWCILLDGNDNHHAFVKPDGVIMRYDAKKRRTYRAKG